MNCAHQSCGLAASLLNTCGRCARVVCDLHFWAVVLLCAACLDEAEAKP